MIVRDMKLTTVTVPFTEPEVWSGGCRHGVTSIVVELECENGITGVGEAVPAPTPTVTAAMLTSLREIVIGTRVDEIERFVNRAYSLGGMYHYAHSANCALAGLEMALWDALGKSRDLPVHSMLGGPVRREVPFVYFVQRKAPEEMAADAVRATEAGFGTVYTKVGLTYESDIAVARAMREAIGPGPRLRLDANEAWSPGTALRILRELEPYDLEYIEQPIPFGDVLQLRTLRQRTTVPIAANQGSWTNRELYNVLAMDAADVVMTDPHQAGGLLAFKKAAGIAEAAGVPIVFHSYGPLAITTYAAMQVIASSTAFLLDNQTYNHMLPEDVVLDVPRFHDGRLTLPDAPGIGVELDRDKLEYFAERYRRDGYLSAYDTEIADFADASAGDDDGVLWYPHQ